MSGIMRPRAQYGRPEPVHRRWAGKLRRSRSANCEGAPDVDPLANFPEPSVAGQGVSGASVPPSAAAAAADTRRRRRPASSARAGLRRCRRAAVPSTLLPRARSSSHWRVEPGSFITTPRYRSVLMNSRTSASSEGRCSRHDLTAWSPRPRRPRRGQSVEHPRRIPPPNARTTDWSPQRSSPARVAAARSTRPGRKLREGADVATLTGPLPHVTVVPRPFGDRISNSSNQPPAPGNPTPSSRCRKASWRACPMSESRPSSRATMRCRAGSRCSTRGSRLRPAGVFDDVADDLGDGRRDDRQSLAKLSTWAASRRPIGGPPRCPDRWRSDRRLVSTGDLHRRSEAPHQEGSASSKSSAVAMR